VLFSKAITSRENGIFLCMPATQDSWTRRKIRALQPDMIIGRWRMATGRILKA